MTGTASKKLLGITALLSFATITAADLQRKKDPGLPSSREWIGLTVVFLMLSAANDLGLESAGGMAVLVMVAIIIARGEMALKFVSDKVQTRQNTPPKPQGTRPYPTQRALRNQPFPYWNEKLLPTR